MPVSVKIRSSQGCWTCRLRRKKCDEKKPICSICSALEISCLYSEAKPDWMDGGTLEKRMMETLKATIKVKASQRRERKWASDILLHESDNAQDGQGDTDIALSQGMSKYTIESSTETDNHDTSGASSYTPGTSVGEDSSPPNHASLESENLVARIPPFEPVSEEMTNSNHIGVHISPYHTRNVPDIESEREISFSMMYLDYVFPYMFPFYRPPLLQSGRGWLLNLLLRNKPLYHTALSLASYFFSMMVGDSVMGNKACMRNSWLELQKQQELSIKSLQNSMQSLTTKGVATSFREATHCLEGIVQLLSLDVTIGNSNNWKMHLEAAASLFEQIVQHHATDSKRPWYSILAAMDETIMKLEFRDGEHPWSSSQGSWRFMTIHLLWTDIIAATALERPPRLEAFHQQLLVGEKPDLRMSVFFGCHTWVMLIIGQIASLHAWKKEMKRSGALSMVELVKKGSCIEQRLRDGISEMCLVPTDSLQDPSARTPDQPYGASPFAAPSQLGPAQDYHTVIWAKAALTYLAVVISGFQPALPEIQVNVAETIELFRMMPNPLCLRTMTWPFAVTGCLALPDQEDFFREMAGKMGMMEVFGTVKEALQIISTVWSHRSCIDPEIWDIPSCLNALGHSSLLV